LKMALRFHGFQTERRATRSRRKTPVLGLILLLLVLSVAVMAAEDTTTITYAFWGNPAAIGVEKDIIEEFEKTHPRIKVTPVVADYNSYHSKLLTLFAGRQAPDVMRIDSYFMADFMKYKALKDITPMVTKDNINMDAFYSAGLLDCMSGKKYYGFPWGTAPAFMFINVKMFRDAGIPIPGLDWKYEDLLRIARKLSKGQEIDRQYGFALSVADLTHIFPFIWSGGGDLFDKSRKKFTLNKPEAYNKLQEIANLIKEGVIPDPAQFTSADVLNRWTVNYKVGMRLGMAAEILSLQKVDGFEFEVLPFPGTPKYPRATISKSNVVGICSTTKNEAAAWEFLKFLRCPGQPGETLYMKAKRVPPSIDSQELWELYADPAKSPKLVVETSKAVASRYGRPLPLRAGWNEIQGALIPQLQRVFADQISAEKAMNEIAPKIQQIMNRTN
jgi:multiple sugar transport system substrate-binding protein